jgi:hypothetical protein
VPAPLLLDSPPLLDSPLLLDLPLLDEPVMGLPLLDDPVVVGVPLAELAAPPAPPAPVGSGGSTPKIASHPAKSATAVARERTAWGCFGCL